MKLLRTIFLLSSLLTALAVQAQQTIRGTVTDAQTLQPLVGARVILIGSEPVKGALTNEEGRFRLEDVPVGRQEINVAYYGYAPSIRPNIIVTIAQEVVLNIALEEQVQSTDAVDIVAKTNKSESINELTSVSARTFSVEEALRYAGSRNDPARMAQNFAGVSGVNDQRNDIIIRGNSPAGVLWRLEGIDMPNPNHFGALGTTGGPVSMLNNNNLSDADFLTSAFPAEYGNALSGVFDMGLRNGNDETFELMGQLGFNGVEAGVEGPLPIGNHASYIANYRYSTLSVFQALGINFGTGAAIPEYQDLTFKVNIPTEKAGRFVIFGLGGVSNINFLDSESGDPNLFNGEGTDLYNTAGSGMLGASHTHLFSKNTYGKLSIALSAIRSGTAIDSLSGPNGAPERWYAEQYSTIRQTTHYQLNHKFSARDLLRVGIIGNLYDIGLVDSVQLDDGNFRKLRDFDGNTFLMQAYAQWQHKFTDRLTLNGGAHVQHFFLNNRQSIEPRIGLVYQAAPKHRISAGLGVHNQLQPLQIYFLDTNVGGDIVKTNEDLNFTRSLQAVLAYDFNITSNLRLKTEVYYQDIDQVPVAERFGSFSMLNAGADFGFPTVDSLLNEGTGQNYGLELTLEKFFADGYYFLLTGSLFESKYAGYDGIVRNTVFNGNYIGNVLGGKEFQLGPNSLSIDGKVTYAGGRRYTPIDLVASRLAGTTVRDESRAYEAQYPYYLRIDLKATFRLNGKKVLQEWSVDMQNLTNRANVFSQAYSPRGDADGDPATPAIQTNFQIGLFPVIQYRILF
ncbi:MAG: TonB-dependent receptor [Bacteroidia bacterium]|nr:TonB-dependent receptor [Bacteroidia bacterium]